MPLEELYVLSRHFLELYNKAYRRSFLETTKLQHRLSILVGSRGVGKTTVLIQYLLQQVDDDILDSRILYVPSDHFLLSNLSLYEIAQQFLELGGEIIAFDEIHKYPNWSGELKSIYDSFPKLKVFASGSSALEIYKGSHDLTRRAIIYKMEGMSFREYLAIHSEHQFQAYSLQEILENQEKISKTVLQNLNGSSTPKILPLFKKYLRTGYYPYFLELKSEEDYWITLEQNVQTTLESDLPKIYPSLTGNSIRKIKQLLSFIAFSVPFTLNLSQLKKIIEIGDERTIKTYCKYLEDAGLIRQVMGASTKMKKLELPEKIYLNNPNQMYAITSQSQDAGTLRELFFLSMVSVNHEVAIAKTGDFWLDQKFVFEIGGRKKDFSQIKNEKNAYLVCDEIEMGAGRKIPLWLLGFLY